MLMITIENDLHNFIDNIDLPQFDKDLLKSYLETYNGSVPLIFSGVGYGGKSNLIKHLKAT